MNISMDLVTVMPELWLAGLAMLLLLIGVFGGDRLTQPLTLAAIAGLAFAALGIALFSISPAVSAQPPIPAFGGMFVNDAFSRFAKLLSLGASALALAMALPYLKARKIAHFEYPVLALFATLGMMLMVSANDLLALYVGLELQSLSLYVLAAFQRDEQKSSEAGLKYFVLGALSSGLLLFGASWLYGLSGTTNFIQLKDFFSAEAASPGALVALIFVMAGLAFKIAAVPFHMWAPDVYEGAPTPVTGFFASAPKVAAMALLIRVLFVPMQGMIHEWQQILIFAALASMMIGGFAAIVQTNIKRLMAYSAIGHAGYVLAGLAAGSEEGIQAALVYLSIYVLNTLGAFAVILAMRRGGAMVETLADLAGLSRSRPLLALAMTVFMFSLAGVPPLAGFFGKFYVFMAAVHAGLYAVAIIGVLTSAVAAYYYLKIVKLMYFDDSRQQDIDPVPELGLRAVVTVAALAMVLFTLMPSPIIDGAHSAAAGLFGR
ncbi:MAG: NADH-quinone oxidoreductase subunit NuoN [Alphaproteobacteria bacterium]